MVIAHYEMQIDHIKGSRNESSRKFVKVTVSVYKPISGMELQYSNDLGHLRWDANGLDSSLLITDLYSPVCSGGTWQPISRS